MALLLGTRLTDYSHPIPAQWRRSVAVRTQGTVAEVSSVPARVWRRAWVVGLTCVVGLTAVYLVAVWTAPGQRFEDAVLRAADAVGGTTEETGALNTLDAVTVPSVVAVVLLVLLVGVLRRRFFLGFLSVGMIAASIATTEVIQRFAQRPVLLAHGYRREDQSFPSGHATVAMALMCALVMMAPYRFRGTAVFLTSLWAAGVGVATVTASWHRPSDTIGADLIVVGYACAAIAVLARCDRVREASLRTPVGRALRGLLAGAYAGVAVLAFGTAAAVLAVVLATFYSGDPGTAILLAGRALALSGSAAVAATLLALLHHVDLGAPTAEPAEEGSRDVEPGHAGIHRPSGA
jgi:membrane-associated phospholipid phosphatase